MGIICPDGYIAVQYMEMIIGLGDYDAYQYNSAHIRRLGFGRIVH